ncbi:hypothetical protein R6Q59_014951 [Mikania micrantha]|uniref:FAS1 domain-containing protein n=1 Tax=Mikania micrantha TaxID=192012 RepID=A0A5N6PF49_9ASTR|nr:hypothetical protein E3N88_07897 [Mikania micrantha]
MQFPAYSEFNNYLTETKLNDEINSRQPVTVLVFNNSLVKEFLSDEPLSVVKVALSIHILLDYFDKQKLMAINDGSTITTTLYQTTGNAVGGTGHVNITDLVGNKVGFGSDANGSRLDALYERSLKQIPYNISIMEISSPIIAPGILKSSPAALDVNFTSLLEEAGCKTFAKMISDAGVLEIYQTVEPRGLTLFAPTDAAFKAPGLPDFNNLTNAEVDSLLLYHAIACYVPKVSLMTEKNPIRTLASNEINGFYLTVRSKGDSVMIDSGMDASRVESTVLDSVPISILKIDQVLFPAGFYAKPPYPAAVPVPESFPPSPSVPGSAPVHPPIASSLAPVAITPPVVSPPAPPASPTSSPFSGPAQAENPAADTGNNNSSGGIKAPAIFLALATLSVWVYMISSIVS